MPNTSNNQLITPTTNNHNSTAASQPMQSNQFDDFSSHLQPQYGNQGNFTNQQFPNYNQNYNPSYWKESGNFYRGNSEVYQSNRGSETKNQYPFPQDPRLEVGEIRMVKNEPKNYQNYEDTNFNSPNDQNLYRNRGFNQDTPQRPQSEQPLQSQRFSQDIQKVNQSHFSSPGTNQDSTSCQSISNITRLQSENLSDQISKPKPKNVRNRKSTSNKQIPKNQSTSVVNSGAHTDINCNDNDGNLTNQQISTTKEIPFRQTFNQGNSQEVHSNSNQGLFSSNQDILSSTSKRIFQNASRNNEDMQFNNSHTSLSESNKGAYSSNSIKQGNDNSTSMTVSFEGIFDNSQVISNHQRHNHQNINSLNTNQSALTNQNIQNSITNHQIIDNSRVINNNSTNQGILLHDTSNQDQLTNNQETVQHSHARPMPHDRGLLMGHQEIEQKFSNSQQQHQIQHQHHQQQQSLQQQQSHQQQNQEQQYQSLDNVLSNRGQVPIRNTRESFMNPNNSSENYNNYLLESNQHMTNQNHNYGTMLPDPQFQSQNILNDQMIHDQEMLLANDQAMLSVLNSTTDANEQALLYNAMVGQSDGQGLLGLLEPPSMLNNQINEYQPVYGPLPPNVKPGLPGGAKTDPESNQYPRGHNIQQMTGRGVGLMTGALNQNELKMYPESNRFSISNANESYSRYSNYSPMFPYTPSTSTPLGSISDILDNIPGPERTYQPPERKNPAPCTMTSQDINPLPPFRSLDNKTKFEYGGTNTNIDIDQSLDEKNTSFSTDKESRINQSIEDNMEPKISGLEEGEIKNPSILIKSGKEEPGIPYDWVSFHNYLLINFILYFYLKKYSLGG